MQPADTNALLRIFCQISNKMGKEFFAYRALAVVVSGTIRVSEYSGSKSDVSSSDGSSSEVARTNKGELDADRNSYVAVNPVITMA